MPVNDVLWLDADLCKIEIHEIGGNPSPEQSQDLVAVRNAKVCCRHSTTDVGSAMAHSIAHLRGHLTR